MAVKYFGKLPEEWKGLSGRKNGRWVHGGSAGDKRHPLYCVWSSMKTRCINPNDASYKNYGGRGITVEEPWRSSFGSFLCDMGPTYVNGLTIDRIDNDGNYCKANCRWATDAEQLRNMRSNVKLTLHGRNMTVAEWSRALLIPKGTIHFRLACGATAAQALCRHRLKRFTLIPFRPVRKWRKRIRRGVT